jgi:uncharacterized lipoprotein YmbA
MILLSGCGSSPTTRFYTLSMVPAATDRRDISGRVQLAAVHIPPDLDRREMVSMKGENSVEISSTNRWAAELDIMIRNILAEDLEARLPRGKLILPEAPAPDGAGTLVVTLTEFGRDAKGEVKLDGSWSLLSGQTGASILRREFHLNGGAAPGADATAAAMSRALGELASQMAATLASR